MGDQKENDQKEDHIGCCKICVEKIEQYKENLMSLTEENENLRNDYQKTESLLMQLAKGEGTKPNEAKMETQLEKITKTLEYLGKHTEAMMDTTKKSKTMIDKLVNGSKSKDTPGIADAIETTGLLVIEAIKTGTKEVLDTLATSNFSGDQSVKLFHETLPNTSSVLLVGDIICNCLV